LPAVGRGLERIGSLGELGDLFGRRGGRADFAGRSLALALDSQLAGHWEITLIVDGGHTTTWLARVGRRCTWPARLKQLSLRCRSFRWRCAAEPRQRGKEDAGDRGHWRCGGTTGKAHGATLTPPWHGLRHAPNHEDDTSLLSGSLAPAQRRGSGLARSLERFANGLERPLPQSAPAVVIERAVGE